LENNFKIFGHPRKGGKNKQKDIPFTVVVPLDAVITEFSMEMNNETTHANIEECARCSEDFIKSIHSGNITSKLRRSKVLEGHKFRVLTVNIKKCNNFAENC